MRNPAVTFVPLCVALSLGCGGEMSLESTAATLMPVRGEVSVDGAAHVGPSRVAPASTVRTPSHGLSRLDLDNGARVLLGPSEVSVEAAGRLTLLEGRAFVETHSQPVGLRVGTVSFHTRDAGYSAEADAAGVVVYVVRGEVGWSSGEASGVVGPGERVQIREGRATAEPQRLWQDWTHGWAQAGPDVGKRPIGMGTLEGRVPEEVGRARWPLVVRRLDVRVRVVEDLAITEVDQVFFNPASEALEGLYRIRVPEGAILSRFAVDRDGRLVDGYVRERAQAAQAYTQQVYRGSTLDPALLEWDGPDAYRARIYPIAPGETRRVVVRYAQWLGGGAHRLYRYPMGASERAPRIQELSVDVDLSEAGASRVRAGLGAVLEDDVVRLRLSDVVPRADLWVELESESAQSESAQSEPARSSLRAWRAPHVRPLRAPGERAPEVDSTERDYWLLPLALPEAMAPAADSEGLDVVVVADLSAATDRGGLELGRAVIEALGSSLTASDRLAVVAADLQLRPVAGDSMRLAGATPERVAELLDGLARVRPAGASDLGEALTEAAALLEPGRSGALVYVGDGRVSVGERTGAELAERVARLPAPVRIYAVGAGAEADLDVLAPVSRGGGLQIRVEEHRQGTDAAHRILAHARRPVAHRVTVQAGDTVEAIFPRGAVDLVIGDTLMIGGRLTGDPPSEVRVSAVVGGQPVERTFALETEEAPDGTDLRLRWASARLSNLVAEGASREEMVELGVRHGLITPHTSFYVPSADELRRQGHLATHLVDRPDLTRMARRAPPVSPMARGAAAVLTWPLGLAGCSEISDEAERLVERGTGGSPAPPPTTEAPVSVPAAPTPPPPPPVLPAPADRPAADPAPASTEHRVAPRRRRSNFDPHLDSTQGSSVSQQLADLNDRAQRCFTGQTAAVVGLRVTVAPSGWATRIEVLSAQPSDSAMLDCLRALVEQHDFGAQPAPVTAQARFVNTAGGPPRMASQLQTARILLELSRAGIQADAHTARPCSDAAALPLAERRELWRERLRAGQTWSLVRALAIADCEARSWRERRALIEEILRHAGSVSAMLGVVRQLGTDAERAYGRRRVLSRVRTPEELRVVRAAFGDDVGRGLIHRVIAEADSPQAKVRALRALSAQYPESFELRLALVAALDDLGQHAPAGRVADRLRADPLADMEVRTALGERLVARGDEAEARRAFSEIVEFAPMDELARRRLGDLYAAHGWYPLAYRQYETLRALRPDDPGVLLLLARAAAGAGRIDEALRLQARVSETQGDSALGRVAALWTSARYARLMHEASGDEDRREALSRRRRRSGVLSHASALRISLTFLHPDAQLALWVGMPGYRPSRPMDIAPEHGIEVFDLAEQESGAYEVEVRRSGDVSTPMEAELVVVWNEGQSDEQIEVLPLTFAQGYRRQRWTLSGRSLRSR